MHRDADQIPNLFGSYVFNEEAMGQYVDEAAMNAWRACLRDGRPLTLDVAGAIADGMKVWALEHGATRFTYHDPCELGRGSGIYDEPRAVIEAVGELLEPASTRENALCCGSSVANTAISDGQQVRIAQSVAAELDATGADVIVTACPLCKKALGRGTKGEIRDLAEIVVSAIK